MDGSVLSGAGRVICGGFLLALKHVPAPSDALRGEFAVGVALGVQEERLSNVAWVHIPRYRNNTELVSAVTQVANTLFAQSERICVFTIFPSS